MKLAATLLACAVLMAGAVGAAAAKKEAATKKEKEKAAASAPAKPALIGSYGDWKVYHSGAGKSKICYLLSQPKKRDPEDADRQQVYAFISERPAEHVRNEISFVMGFDIATASDIKDKKKPKKGKKADAPAAVGPSLSIGDQDFELAPKGSDLWIKNPAEEGKVIAEMKKGSGLVIKAAARKGGRMTDSYSLSGFSQAIDKALKDCPES